MPTGSSKSASPAYIVSAQSVENINLTRTTITGPFSFPPQVQEENRHVVFYIENMDDEYVCLDAARCIAYGSRATFLFEAPLPRPVWLSFVPDTSESQRPFSRLVSVDRTDAGQCQ